MTDACNSICIQIQEIYNHSGRSDSHLLREFAGKPRQMLKPGNKAYDALLVGPSAGATD